MSETIISEILKLEPSAIVELFELDATAIGGDHLRFHQHTQTPEIYWQGYQFAGWPVEGEGFAMSSDRPTNPTLRVGNVGGSISAMCVYFDDLVGSKLIRRRTLAKFLDAANFPEGNPSANPNEELPLEIWYIERKVSETVEMVEFELASALDLNGIQLPRRQIIANLCPWRYRGPECGYTGGPVADANDQPTGSSAQDSCGKRIASCRLRFGASAELPFGGFPAAGLMR